MTLCLRTKDWLRPILFSLGLLLAAQTALAWRPDSILMVSIGLQGRTLLSNARYAPYQEHHTGTGWLVGANVRLTNSNYLAFLLECNYLKSSHSTLEHENSPAVQKELTGQPLKVTLQRIQLPMAAELAYPTRIVRFSILAGIYGDLLLIEHKGLARHQLPIPIHMSTHTQVGFGLLAGAGIGLQFAFGTIALDYRFDYRFSNIYRVPTIPAKPTPRQNLMEHQIGLSYYYTLTYLNHKQ